MKRVLLTGASGFLGTHILAELSGSKKYQVTAAFHSTDPILMKKANNIRLVPMDLTEYAKTKKLVKGHDIVIHLAALVQGTGRYHDAPATVLSENFIIDNNVFKAAVAAKVERLIYMSSHEILRFANDQKEELSEHVLEQEFFPSPPNAYAFSKYVGVRLLEAYHQEYGLPFVLFYNLSYDYGVLPTPKTKYGFQPRVVGGVTKAKQKKTGWIPQYIELVQKMLKKNTPLVMRGDLKQKRYWTDLRDTAHAFVLAIDAKDALNQNFFIASTQSLTMEQFAKAFFEKIRPGEKFAPQSSAGFRLPSLYHVPDTKKAEKLLGWKAKYRLEDSIDAIVLWVKNEFPKSQ